MLCFQPFSRVEEEEKKFGTKFAVCVASKTQENVIEIERQGLGIILNKNCSAKVKKEVP